MTIQYIPYIPSLLIGIIVLLGLGGNAYLYQCQKSANRSIQMQEKALQQKKSLIGLASDKSSKSSSMGHRLAIPCTRLSISEDFQHLSKSLKLARLDFQISPETIVQEAFSESNVELKFQNSSDQPLFLMMAYLMDEFPGLVYPLEIVLWRDVSSEEPLIMGTFRFQWLKAAQRNFES